MRKTLVMRLLIGVGFATVSVIGPAAQQPAAPAPNVAPTVQADSAACAQAQPRLLQTIDAANARIEVARQSNTPAVMRAAIDDLQGTLGSLRAQLANCAASQAVPGSDAHAGHVMPGAPPPAPAAASPADPHAGHAMPPGGSAALIKDPRCTAVVTPETAPRAEHGGQSYYFCSERDRQLFVTDPVKYLADAHAGHVMPTSPQTARPAAATSARSGAPPAGAHAGHVMPSAPAAPARGAAAPPRRGASAPAADPHAGMAMPGTARGAARATRPAPAAPKTVSVEAPAPVPLPGGRRPVTELAQLKCDRAVNSRTAPRMLYRGRMYYFCTQEERAAFAKSPEKYVAAPASSTAPAHAH